MASLENQSVSSSYEQLLHVDRDGGGNGTTHVAVKDGDNGTTFPITLATDAIMITSTNRLEFGDNGTFIHQSADGVLDLVSDTTLELNGASGSMKIDTNSRISLSNNDSGTSNTVFGKLAGDDLASGGNYNSFFGDNTGGNTTGDYNVAIGMQALKSLPDGDKNVAIGVNAMEAQDDTANGLNDCVAIGFEAFQGTNAGTSAPSGTVAIGSQSLKVLTTGAGNTAVGFESLKTENDGSRNTAIGYKALTTLNTSAGNGETTAIGFEAGMDVSTGIANTFVGSRAGNQGTNDITTGSNNTMIGKEARGSANSASNQTVIGASATGVADNSVTLGNADVTDVYIAPGQTSEQSIVFRDSVDAGKIVYSHSNEQIQFRVGGTGGNSIKARIRTGGDLYLDGGQIAFPGTPVGSSDANTLDDYEEGTWTPTLTTNGTDFGSVTYDSLTGGRYTKIGNVVHFQGFLRTDAVTVGSASNDTAIGGLPFTAIASNGGKVDGQSAMNIGTVSGWAGENPSHGMVMGNTSFIQIYYMDYNVDAVNIASGSDVTAGTSADKNAIYFSGTYISS